jgi:hypothetical protein
MGQVDRCVEEDIPDVARIHVKIHDEADKEPSEGLKSYYREVFFHNPWCDSDFPSLVYRSKQGRVIGFQGVIPRRMNLNGKPVRVAIAHRLMVAPDSNSPLAAMKLEKVFLSGQQDLSISDGANDIGRKFMEGMGASTAYLYSMNWFRPLHPCCYIRSIFRKKGGLRLLATASWPVCYLIDSLVSNIPHSPLRSAQPQNCTALEMNGQLLFACISDFSKQRYLRPEYNSKAIEWLWDFLKANNKRGKLRGLEVHGAKGQRIGMYLYYLNSEKVVEVMLLLARDDSRDVVFKHLLYHARRQGAVCILGRLEPVFLKSLWDNNCLIKRGSWAIIHAKDPELISVINRGDAFMSTLEGELWLRSPRDKL